MIDYNIQLLPISPKIAPYIQRIVYAEATIQAPFDQAIYPTGYIKIPFCIKGRPAISIKDKGIDREIVEDGFYFSGLVVGDNAYMHFVEDLHWLWIELKAGMGHYLFHLDMTHLVNTTTHFSKVSNIAEPFSKEAIQVRDDLEAVIDVYNRFIISCASNRLSPITYIDEAVTLIESHNGNITIQEVLDLVNIPVSEKQFVRNFKKVVGLSPKHWCRVRQLGYVIELMGSKTDLTKIAIDAGFYDQAHLNRSFQEFVRLSPKRFIEGEQTNLMKFWLNNHQSVLS